MKGRHWNCLRYTRACDLRSLSPKTVTGGIWVELFGFSFIPKGSFRLRADCCVWRGTCADALKRSLSQALLMHVMAKLGEEMTTLSFALPQQEAGRHFMNYI